MAANVVEIESSAIAEHDDRRHDFAVPLVWSGDCSRLGYRRMRFKDLLDLPGRDGFAAANDDVLDAVGDGQSPVGVQVPEIACAKPPVACERAIVQLGIAVADELVGPLHHHLTVDAHWHAVTVLV